MASSAGSSRTERHRPRSSRRARSRRSVRSSIRSRYLRSTTRITCLTDGRAFPLSRSLWAVRARLTCVFAGGHSAQRGRLCKQGVVGSSPIVSTTRVCFWRIRGGSSPTPYDNVRPRHFESPAFCASIKRVPQPSSRLVTPKMRSRLSAGGGPSYMRTVLNTGVMPCRAASAAPARFGSGRSR